MAGHGSAPGERRGGRPKGSRNKATLERLEAERVEKQIQAEVAKRAQNAESARRIAEEARAAGRKLANEVLDEFMQLFAGMAAYYQPHPTKKTGHEDPAQFKEFARLTVETAKALAPFQSPTYKAIEVRAPAPEPVAKIINAENVVAIDDPVALSRVYQRRISGIGR